MDKRAHSSLNVHRWLLDGLEAHLAHSFDPAVSMLVHAIIDGHKVLIAGNGMSCAIGIGLAAQLLVRYELDRKGYPAIALSCTSQLTAAAIDGGLTRGFARQVEALGESGDVLVSIGATSDPPGNLIEAIASAKRAGMPTLGLCGKKGLGCDVDITLPDAAIPRVHEMHLVCVNLLVEGLEARLPP